MKLSIVTISLILITTFNLNAQIKIPVSEKSLSVSEKNILDNHFKKYKVFSVNKQEVLDSLQNHGKCRLNLNIDKNNNWDFCLRLNDMRAPDFVASYTSNAGSFQYNNFKPSTYKGITSDNEIARFTIDEDEFWGIITNNERQVMIRQTKDYTNTEKDESLLLFENSDVILCEDNPDIITDMLIAPVEINNTSNISKSALCTYYLQIATEADFEFFQDMGSNLLNAYSYIFSVLNLIEGIYESTFDLKFIVPFQNVWTTSNDPYSNTTDSYTLLQEFRNEWNTNRTGITRDIAHLFTGRDYSGYGIAWYGQIGTSYAYSSSEFRTEMFETTAHEIGHNLHATDANLANPVPPECLCGGETASVMCQGLKANNLWFCQLSISQISPFLVNNSSLLTGSLQDNLTLTGINNGFNEYQSREKITSTQVINSGTTVYKTMGLELNGGFDVILGAEFQLVLDDNGCD